MSKRKHEEQELPFVALMDTMTNVVGVLIIVMVMVGISLAAAVNKILSDLPPVTEAEHKELVEQIKKLPPMAENPTELQEKEKIAQIELRKVTEELSKMTLRRCWMKPQSMSHHRRHLCDCPIQELILRSLTKREFWWPIKGSSS
jgi:CO dehydrogenase/acetyl-CoA synthase alpha subunit